MTPNLWSELSPSLSIYKSDSWSSKYFWTSIQATKLLRYVEVQLDY